MLPPLLKKQQHSPPPPPPLSSLLLSTVPEYGCHRPRVKGSAERQPEEEAASVHSSAPSVAGTLPACAPCPAR